MSASTCRIVHPCPSVREVLQKEGMCQDRLSELRGLPESSLISPCPSRFRDSNLTSPWGIPHVDRFADPVGQFAYSWPD